MASTSPVRALSLEPTTREAVCRMEWVVFVVVFLLGGCVGLLVGIFVKVARFTQRAEAVLVWMVERYEALHAERLEQDRTLHAERRDHFDATTAIVVERMHLIGSALAGAIRETATQHRNDLRLATGLPAVLVPDNGPPSAVGRQKRHSGEVSRAAWRVPAAPTLGRVDDDEPTPPSGWSPEDIRNRTHGAEPLP